MLNVVVINGGRGAGTLIPALLRRQGLHVTSIVNAYDDGKSTGEIRKFFGMLGPSDLRKVQELMLPEDDPDYAANCEVFSYRFPDDAQRETVLAQLNAFASGETDKLLHIQFQQAKIRSALRSFVSEFLAGLNVIEKIRGEQLKFADCSIMNCIYAGAFLVFQRNIELATLFIDRLFKLKGTVLPTSIEDKKLVALRENGEILYSEAEIVELRSSVRVERVYLLDESLDKDRFETLSAAEKRYYLERHHCRVPASPKVELALQQADIIIYAAGTQHSSLYPTYMSSGIARNIADNKHALKVFVTNIGADYETPSYHASDYIKGAHKYLNLSDARFYGMHELFDCVLVNQSGEGENYVDYDEAGFQDVPVRRIVDVFENLDAKGRHDGDKVTQLVMSLHDERTVPFGGMH